MTRLHIFSSRDNGRETTGMRRLPVRVSWLLCCLLAVSLLGGLSPLPSVSLAYAAQLEGEEVEPFIADPNSVATDAPLAPDNGSAESVESADGDADAGSTLVSGKISIDLSEPETWQEGGMVFYKTTLTVTGAETFLGYQIQVEAQNEDSIEIVDSFGGLKTEPVYKDGSVYLASMTTTQTPSQTATQQASLTEAASDSSASSTPTSESTVACEIIAKYPASDYGSDKMLVVRSFQVLESVSPEAITTIGPDPAAAVLDLTPLISAGRVQIVLIVVLALGVLAALVIMLKKRGLAKKADEHVARYR